MTNLILFDNDRREHLLPLTYLRPVAELRVGILTIREKWERALGIPAAYLTQDYLAEKYPLHYGQDNLLVNATVLPDRELLLLLRTLEPGQAYLRGEELIAAYLPEREMDQLINDEDFGDLRGFELPAATLRKINHPYDIFALNDWALRQDFELLTAERTSEPLPASCRLIGPPDQLFIEPGCEIEAATFNTKTGPIYIGPNCTVMEGALVRGGLAMGPHSTLKMGAKVYGATTLGPYCKVGGEVSNSVLFGYSNKSHEGYLGNSVLAEWCNLGADTNTSNLKNTYDEVRMWNYPAQRFLGTGLQFCGLIMGDHSKSGIDTTFNTGTVIGVSSNIFGPGFPRQFIPSFAWGGPHGLATYRTDKALATMERVMARRGQELSVADRLMLIRVYEDTARFRRWEK
jgi:UDP-N-acetylglucosamine diphosphorylase/glucosamine-1-phosphate N-acetyltransferase